VGRLIIKFSLTSYVSSGGTSAPPLKGPTGAPDRLQTGAGGVSVAKQNNGQTWRLCVWGAKNKPKMID